MEVFRENFWKNSAKFFFVPVNISDNAVISRRIAHVANYLGIVNYVVVTFNDTLQVFSSSVFSSSVFTFGEGFHGNFSVVFPYKLNDMKSFALKVKVGSQLSRLNKRNGCYEGIDLLVLDIIARKHNATIKQIEINTKNLNWNEIIISYLLQGKADLSLLTNSEAVKYGPYWQTINTYDEKSFCALVRIPDRVFFLHFIMKLVDLYSRIIILTFIAVSAVIWKFVRKTRSKSTLSFIFGILVSFFGQSIPFKNINRAQNLILLFCFIMTSVISSAYESLIIASMFHSRDGIRLKTFDQLFASGEQLQVASLFLERMKLANESKILANMISITENSKLQPSLRIKSTITRCEMIHSMYDDVAKDLYLLPDQMMPSTETFMLRMFSPLYDLLQLYFDLIFESGIRQHLKKMLESSQNAAKVARDAEFYENEQYFLFLADISGLFYILATGYGVASIVFAFERFFNPAMMLLQKIHARSFRRRLLLSCRRIFRLH